MSCIYLDYNATTPVDPRALEAMLPYLRERFGNASSKSHPYGWAANEAVEAARESVARLIGASAREIVFTSGATEGNNIAIQGLVAAARAQSSRRTQLITQATEHHAVLDVIHAMRRHGMEVVVLQPDARGRIEPEQVAAAVTERTLLVSIMAANNEVGTVQPLAAISAAAHARGALVHADAAQAIGKVPVSVDDLGVDLLSLSGHKAYAPKGVGALYVRRTAPLKPQPLQLGGGQERGLRPGTINVPGVVALGEAARAARADLPAEMERLARMRDGLFDAIAAGLDGVRRNGDPDRSLPGTLSLSFEGIDGTALFVSLPDLAISSGSACQTGSSEPSHVLKAMGVPDTLAHATARLSLGRFTTQDEVDRAGARLVEAVRGLRRSFAGARETR